MESSKFTDQEETAIEEQRMESWRFSNLKHDVEDLQYRVAKLEALQQMNTHHNTEKESREPENSQD